MSTHSVFAFTQHGGPDTMVFHEREVPEPREGELRIAVRAASINPFDVKFREGSAGPESLKPPRPMGMDAAGVVEAVGEGVDGFSPGDRVVGSAGLSMRGGALAPSTIVKAEKAVLLPEGISDEWAATLPTAGTAALDMLGALEEPTVGVVAVLGAGGAVGQFVLQIAQTMGLRPVGIARSGHRETIEELGGTFIDAEQDPTTALRDLAPTGVAGVIDLVGGDLLRSIGPLAAQSSSIVSAVDPETAEELGGGGRPSSKDALARLVDLVAKHGITVRIAERYPLERAAEAYDHLENRHPRGKIVISV